MIKYQDLLSHVADPTLGIAYSAVKVLSGLYGKKSWPELVKTLGCEAKFRRAKEWRGYLQ
jgi:hypothetical protein